MDNEPIDTPSAVKTMTESRDHEIINLPPCSPSLNAIEELWTVVKSSIKRQALKADDTLTQRTIFTKKR